MTKALLLNASYEPHDVIRDRDAVSLILDEDAEMVEHSGQYFRSQHLAIPIPSVLRLIRYVVMPDKRRSVLLKTATVLARDDYVCAYCGGVADTMDHIIPRALGGKHIWENVTAACRKCNHKKRDRTLADLGWELTRTPTRPRGVCLPSMALVPEWKTYLQVA